jgi:hypothetical protein
LCVHQPARPQPSPRRRAAPRALTRTRPPTHGPPLPQANIGAAKAVSDIVRTTLGPNTGPIVRDRVAAIVCVGEAEIAAALRCVYERAKLAIEPSAAVGVAVALSGQALARVLREHLPAGAWEADRALEVGVVPRQAMGARAKLARARHCVETKAWKAASTPAQGAASPAAARAAAALAAAGASPRPLPPVFSLFP